jgi:cysteine-rich repeat protein
MKMLRSRGARAGRALGWLLLLAGPIACHGVGGRANDTDDTDDTGSDSTAGGPGGPSSEAPSSGADDPDVDTGECLPGQRGCSCILGGVCDDDLVCEDGTCESFDPMCGDGQVEGDEQCDLGDALDDLGECKTDCTLASCGDGLVGPGEACDDGNLIAHDQCTNACRPPACGDGVLHDGEECDDANDNDGDDCTNACLGARCGDGVVWRGNEACDDGNASDTDACTNACISAACGDGIPNNGEACDDANVISTDGCIGCVPATCGDGHRWAGVEACDGVELGGATCMTQGFIGGTLTCATDCVLDTSACTL